MQYSCTSYVKNLQWHESQINIKKRYYTVKLIEKRDHYAGPRNREKVAMKYKKELDLAIN